MDHALQQFFQIPPFTRWYVTSVVATTLLCHLNLVSPYQLYLNPKLVFEDFQLWRLVTTFVYLGPINFSYILHLIYTMKYSGYLEEGHFRTRPEEFFIMVVLAFGLMLACAIPLKVYFLAPSLTSMITYVWARKNPNMHVSLMFILNFQAAYLPWVLLGLYTFFEGSIPVTEVIGITVGHIYFYLEDIVPKLTGWKVLKAPEFLRNAFHREDDPFAIRDDGNILDGPDPLNQENNPQ